VNDNAISTSEDVVWMVYSSGAGAYIYIMFNRAAGPNSGAPGSRDNVIVHSHAGGLYDDSFIVASLSQGQSYTYSNWINTSSLTISVCSISLGSPGVSRVLVYLSDAPISCDVSTPSPTTKKVTAAPTKSPVKAPTKAPTKSPVKAPTKAPTKSPVQAPTQVTAAPVSELCQDTSKKFTYQSNQRKNCLFIGRSNTAFRCSLQGVAENCPVTCQVGCQCFDTVGRFKMGQSQRSCVWVARTNTEARCRNNVARSNCPITCGICSA
jgi:hypothetical protein